MSKRSLNFSWLVLIGSVVAMPRITAMDSKKDLRTLSRVRALSVGERGTPIVSPASAPRTPADATASIPSPAGAIPVPKPLARPISPVVLKFSASTPTAEDVVMASPTKKARSEVVVETTKATTAVKAAATLASRSIGAVRNLRALTAAEKNVTAAHTAAKLTGLSARAAIKAYADATDVKVVDLSDSGSVEFSGDSEL